jgi:transcriptional regulator with XRE-family HTH domain
VADGPTRGYTSRVPLSDEARALIGSRIRKARKKLGLTGSQLAARLPPAREDGSVTKAVVSMWESGDRTPSIGRLADIAAMLGTTVSRLTYGVQSDICDEVQRTA